MNDKDIQALKALAQRIEDADEEPMLIGRDAAPAILFLIASHEQQAARIAELEANSRQVQCDESWAIVDPIGAVAKLRAAAQTLLDEACKRIGSKDDDAFARAATAVDNALADCVGFVAQRPAVDLSGLTRYGYYGIAGMRVDSLGDYLKLTDVQALLSSPASDVGGLTYERVLELATAHEPDDADPLSKIQFSEHEVFEFARAIEREVLATKAAGG